MDEIKFALVLVFLAALSWLLASGVAATILAVVNALSANLATIS